MRITKKRGLKYGSFFAAGVAAVLIAAAAVSAVSSDERSANAIDPAPKDGHLRETFTRELQLPEGASVKVRNESGSVAGSIGMGGPLIEFRTLNGFIYLNES